MVQWPHVELMNASSIPSAGRLAAADTLRVKGFVPFCFFTAKTICERDSILLTWEKSSRCVFSCSYVYKGTTVQLLWRQQSAWEVRAVAMTLDQTQSLFLKKRVENSQLPNFPETVYGRKTNKHTQKNENQVIICRTDVFQAVKGKQIRITDVCRIKYVLSYICCSTWKISICWHPQELSSDSKEQMKVARHFGLLGHLKSLWKNTLHLPDRQQDYFMPSIHIKHCFI